MTYLYEFAFSGPVNNAHGLIATDCDNCSLAAVDITNWNLTVSINGVSQLLTPGNSDVDIEGVGLTATQSALYFPFFDFSSSNYWRFRDTSTFGNQLMFCGGACGHQGINWQVDALGGGSYWFAPAGTMVAMAVPEPETWVLMLLGLTLGALKWRKKAKLPR